MLMLFKDPSTELVNYELWRINYGCRIALAFLSNVLRKHRARTFAAVRISTVTSDILTNVSCFFLSPYRHMPRLFTSGPQTLPFKYFATHQSWYHSTLCRQSTDSVAKYPTKKTFSVSGNITDTDADKCIALTPKFALLRILPPALVPPDGVLGPDEHKKLGTGSVSFRLITDRTRLSFFFWKQSICALFSPRCRLVCMLRVGQCLQKGHITMHLRITKMSRRMQVSIGVL
jgi:hypothetical protein